MTRKYEITLCWSNEDAAFIADVPELPGCMAHGGTQADALENVNEAMQLWIDTAHEFGDPTPERGVTPSATPSHADTPPVPDCG